MTVTVGLAGPDDMDEVYALRHEVFVVGQDVPAEMERDEHDDAALHAVARRDGRLVGTGRVLAPGLGESRPDAATVGRMAVEESARRLGTGAQVLARLEQAARDAGWPAVELHAQVHALGFYERAGYAPYGAVYLEAGIEHRSMRKVLGP